MKVHEFTSTSEAYDRSQVDDNIEIGDVLVVKSEHVVGFLLSAWPVAVTKEHGAFHQKDSSCTWEYLIKRIQIPKLEGPDYSLSLREAQRIAKELEYELD